ncbi:MULTISPECIES: hypothetical protein [Flavobacteriaceae]|uniref:DUF916 domain-containing protein n=2 Tax=Flavobacteriaceae TaxID=49546 RepID=A0A4Y8AQM1_9FLAO|nr:MULTISPECIES: hypothetical protein [Flavobacteriaceae]TEW72134.1 hypothetical protein E2488_14815 [Gramella jeungdoensis]GGK56645.1 hypothetical protein GCM10007963_26090 [Lutibacter litoralis]
MKINILKYKLITSFIIALLFSFNGFAQEEDASNYRMRFKFKTVKQPDNSRLLEVSFIGQNKKDRKDKVPVFDAEIKFYNEANLLGTAKTSKEGIAQLTVPENHNYTTDEDEYINFIAKFEGSDGLDEEEDEIHVKNLYLELNLEEIDSVKTVLVKAFTIDSLGVEIPLEEADIVISVNGMISKMKLEEGTIEDGEFEFEFPTDIPGDANGDIIVYSIISDNDDFGNIIQQKSINWGTFKTASIEEGNKLWSEAAPIWMYIVLTILLVGVWANYVYTAVNLFNIKKEGKELELKKE